MSMPEKIKSAQYSSPDFKNNLWYAWYGGKIVKVFNMESMKEIDSYEINSPALTNASSKEVVEFIKNKIKNG